MFDAHLKLSTASWLGVPLALLGASCLTSGLDGYAAGGAGGSGGGGHSTSRGAAGGDSGTAGSANGGHDATGTGGSACSAMCGGQCVDLDNDPKHCGACDKECPPSYGCTKGTCDNVPVDIIAGQQVTCAVLHGGELWCWGRDVWGEVGIPPGQASATCTDEHSDRCQPSPIKLSLPPVAEVGTGSEFTCARTIAGDVYCWGSNNLGRLGHDPASDSMCAKGSIENPTPPTQPCSAMPQKVAMPAGVKAVELSVGVNASCIVDTHADVYCWGDNSEGVIQSPVGGSSFTPVKNQNANQNVVEVNVSESAEGWTTACVIRTTSKRVDCWGASVSTLFNTSGASGCAFGPCDPSSHPVPTNFGNGTGEVMADHVQIGYETGCVLDGGSVVCWGNNAFGQSGDGSSESVAHFDPKAIGMLPTTISQISMSFATTLALAANGQVYALGWNSIGQTGNGNDTGANCHANTGFCLFTAHADAALTNVARVSSGAFGSAALTKDGKVLVWGSNYAGEQGHAPGTAGDMNCGGGAFCNPAPQVVGGLP